MLVDNHKSTVLLASNSGRPRFNERFVNLAGHYGFTLLACRPYRARNKGKDECTPALRRTQCGASVVGYVKGNFLVRYRAFESWADLNQLAETWLAEEADQRVQGTVKEVVAERFLREAPCLKPLPLHRYDTSCLELRRVGWDRYVNVRGNRYSVPGELAGQTVAVRLGLDDRLRVFHADQLVASHSLGPAEARWSSVPDHHAALWQATLKVEQRPLEAYEEVATGS